MQGFDLSKYLGRNAGREIHKAFIQGNTVHVSLQS